MNTRVQLSLYASGAAAAAIEAVRKSVDPIQHALIPAHVTLCREDELEGLSGEVLQARFSAWQARPITLQFGSPEVFSSHGLLLPCIKGLDAFQALRNLILGSTDARQHLPHITLAHPRNPKSVHNSLAATTSLEHGLVIRFAAAFRIRQQGHAPWQVLETFRFAEAADAIDPPPAPQSRSGSIQ